YSDAPVAAPARPKTAPTAVTMPGPATTGNQTRAFTGSASRPRPAETNALTGSLRLGPASIRLSYPWGPRLRMMSQTLQRSPSQRPERSQRLARFKRRVIGKPLSSDRLIHERLGKPTALAVFASDNLSSSAYAS